MVQIVLDAALQANTLTLEQVEAPVPLVIAFFETKEKDIITPIPEVKTFFEEEVVPIPEIFESDKDLPTIKIEDLVEDRTQK